MTLALLRMVVLLAEGLGFDHFPNDVRILLESACRMIAPLDTWLIYEIGVPLKDYTFWMAMTSHSGGLHVFFTVSRDSLLSIGSDGYAVLRSSDVRIEQDA